MERWIRALPSEIAYGLATAIVLALVGWLIARVRRERREDDRSSEVQHVYEGPVMQAGTIHEFHLYASRSTSPVPRRLPRAPLRFVNRELELTALDRLLERAEGNPGPLVAVLNGMHGVGKSAMGSYWANSNHRCFPSGALFGDFSKRRSGVAVDVSDVLGDFLRDLGAAEVAIPVTLAAKQSLFQRLTVEKKLLVFLDDVDQPAQVIPLLPAGAGSVVIVTSNFRLEELVREGAEAVPVPPFDEDVSRRLLGKMAGVERIEAEPRAVELLIDTCAGLPIALCVCGARLATHPTRTVSWLADQITSEPRPLHALSPPGAYAVEAVFDFTYRDLPKDAAFLYRRIGLHPGPDLIAAVAATLAGLPLAAVEAPLEVLYDAHLIEQPSEGRFRVHELVRQHMRVCAERHDSAESREQGLRHLVDWYYAALRAADRAIVEDRLRLSDTVRVHARTVPEFSSPLDAFRWFDAERRNVMAVLRLAFEREWDHRVWQFAEALWPLCASHKRFSEWIESHQDAAVSGQRLGDAAVEARIRSQLARAYAELGQTERVDEEMRAASAAAVAAGNELLRASVTEFGGVCLLRRGDNSGALEAFVEARAMFEAGGSMRGVALQDYHIGWSFVRAGKYVAALEPLERARATMAEIGDEINVGRILVRRGEALGQLGRHNEARAALGEAVKVLCRVGIWFERAEAFEALAHVAETRDEEDVARMHWQQAYRIYQEFGHPRADELLTVLGGRA